MKRIALVVACLAFVLLSFTAYADYSNCPCCADGECHNLFFSYYTMIFPDSDTHHQLIQYEESICSVCLETRSTKIDAMWYERHIFNKNTCTECGHRRSTENTEQEKDIPSGNELQAQAYQMGDKLIGAMAKCVYGGNIRQEPSEYAYRVGKIQADDTYKILDYEVTSSYPTSVWLKIDYGYTYAWVSASLMQITGANGYGGYASGGMTGQIVRITVSSGRARTNPGSNYPIIEYVGRGEEYTVLDSAYASDGNLWYKIKKDENFCWISSGITK